MKKHLLSFVFFISSSALLIGQTTFTKVFESTSLDDTRTLTITLPASYEKDSISNFPLAIVLDSDRLFDLYVSNAALYAKNDVAPAQIIVGISLNNSYKKDTYYDTETHALTPENVHFLYFIKDELMPYLQSTYKTAPFTTLIGEGAASNSIRAFLKKEEPLFNAYICINPNFSPIAGQEVHNYQLNNLEAIDNTYYFYTNTSPFLSTGKKAAAADIQKAINEVTTKNFHFLFDEMSTSPSALSAMSEAIPRALTHVFQLYAGITKKVFEEELKLLSPPEVMAYLENKYLDIDYLFGSNLGIRERDIYAIESLIIDKDNGDYLKDFGKMILNIYPSSPLGDYYIGLYYETGKRYSRAAKHYKVAFGKMNPSDPNADLFYENIERVNALEKE